MSKQLSISKWTIDISGDVLEILFNSIQFNSTEMMTFRKSTAISSNFTRNLAKNLN